MSNTQPAPTIRRIFAMLYDKVMLLIIFSGITIPSFSVYIAYMHVSNSDLNPSTLVHKIFPYDYIITTIIGYIYFSYFEQSKQQATPGKKVFGLKITDTSGKKLSFWRASMRYILYSVISYTLNIPIPKVLLKFIPNYFVIHSYFTSFILNLIAITWLSPIFFTKNKTGIYELLSNTKVIYTNQNISVLKKIIPLLKCLLGTIIFMLVSFGLIFGAIVIKSIINKT
ncbi:MAG: RDD family protein [Rickettsiales bacterium]|nr:RDD family protein [Rickettsiales bacterium]